MGRCNEGEDLSVWVTRFMVRGAYRFPCTGGPSERNDTLTTDRSDFRALVGKKRSFYVRCVEM